MASEPIVSTATLQFVMRAFELRELLQMLVSAGAILPADAQHLCAALAKSTREMPVGPDVEDYRELLATRYEEIAEKIV